MGLRMVKKTVNQDEPSVYHLFYADEQGSPGADLTFFEFPGAPPGRAGAGMVHRIGWRVGSPEALDFWADRLARPGREPSATASGSASADPEGLEHELRVADVADQPLIADHPEVPAELALQGFDGARAYSADPERSADLLEHGLDFERPGLRLGGARRPSAAAAGPTTSRPPSRGSQGAGTVHHIAWASQMDEHEAWRERAIEHGARPTPVIDRFWFRRSTSASRAASCSRSRRSAPASAIDEDPEHLGEKLILPPFLEDRREEIEAQLTPIDATRARSRSG